MLAWVGTQGLFGELAMGAGPLPCLHFGTNVKTCQGLKGSGGHSYSLDYWDQVRKNEAKNCNQVSKNKAKNRDHHKKLLVRALQACGRVSEAEWVNTCGQNFRVGKCLNCGADPAYPITCDHRLCPDCAAKRASLLISEHGEMLKQLRYPKMLTLTFKSVDRLTKEYFRWARNCFTRLRRRKVLAGCWGGIYSFEVTHSEKGWHVHIHALVGSGYINQAELSKEWEQITGACVVDIRSISKHKGGKWGAVKEVIKYPAKSVSFCGDPDLVDEFLKATERVNLVYGFGALYRVRTKRHSDERMRCPVCGSNNIAWNGGYGFCVLGIEVERVGGGWLWRGPPVAWLWCPRAC